ncbi:hypothetical protein QE250_16830 [Chromatiaceae bacterium AAb-1]|nr:hypothetical protein [Chromatiaceae bacterium AAb-1]
MRKLGLPITLISIITSLSLAVLAEPVTIEYQYDVLKRVIEINDSKNGDRFYQYDAAGNRTAVSGEVIPPLPVLPLPTGLRTYPISYTNPQLYFSMWSAVPGATYYNVMLINGNTHSNLTVTNIQKEALGLWVKACNPLGCSEESYF